MVIQCGGSDTERGLELSCPKSLQAPEHRRARLYRAVRESCRLGRSQPVQKVLRSLSSDAPLALWQEPFSIANASIYADAVGETIEKWAGPGIGSIELADALTRGSGLTQPRTRRGELCDLGRIGLENR